MDDFAAALQMPDLAVGPHDPLIDAEPLTGLEGSGDLVPDTRPILLLDARDEVIESAAKFAVLEAVDLVELPRPGDPVGWNVPHPAAEIGDALRFQHMQALLPDFRLRGFALIDFTLQRTVCRCELGGALLY